MSVYPHTIPSISGVGAGVGAMFTIGAGCFGRRDWGEACGWLVKALIDFAGRPTGFARIFVYMT